MSVPTGARQVVYEISIGNDLVQIPIRIECSLIASPEEADAAAQAAADAAVTHLRTVYPSDDLSARRRYDCLVYPPGWPLPPAGE